MPARVTRVLSRPLLLLCWKHPYTLLGTPLVDRYLVDEFAQAFTREIAAGEHGRFAMLRRCSDDIVLRAIREAARDVSANRSRHEPQLG